MKAFKCILYFLTVIILISSFLGGCRSEKDSSDKTDDDNITYSDKDRSIIVAHDTLRSNLTSLLEMYNCFVACADCRMTPCNPKCDTLCKKFNKIEIDRSIITAIDTLRQGRSENLLVLTQMAVDLRKMFNYKSALSKNNSLKFNLMKVELDNLIDNLDIMYRAALLNENNDKQGSMETTPLKNIK